MYYIGLDVHKRTISYCVKDGSGAIHAEGTIPATRFDLDRWMKTLLQPWTAAMEATVFTGWIHDHLLPHAAALKVAHPADAAAMRRRRIRKNLYPRSSEARRKSFCPLDKDLSWKSDYRTRGKEARLPFIGSV